MNPNPIPSTSQRLRRHARALYRLLIPSRLPLRGPYPSYAMALLETKGYDSPLVVEQVWHAVVEVLEGRAAYERDGTAFPSRPDLPIHEALRSLIRPDTTIADFGGGLGGLFINAPDLFPPPCRRIVMEQASMVAAGKRLAQEYRLGIEFLESGHSRLPSVDVLVMSSVLSYLPDPWAQITALLQQASPEAILLDRTAVCDGPSRWYRQISTGYYSEPLTYPMQVLNRNQLLRALHGYRLVRRWHNSFDPARPEHVGMLLLREESGEIGG